MEKSLSAVAAVPFAKASFCHFVQFDFGCFCVFQVPMALL